MRKGKYAVNVAAAVANALTWSHNPRICEGMLRLTFPGIKEAHIIKVTHRQFHIEDNELVIDEDLWALWPDDTMATMDEIGAGDYNWKSDDFQWVDVYEYDEAGVPCKWYALDAKDTVYELNEARHEAGIPREAGEYACLDNLGETK